MVAPFTTYDVVIYLVHVHVVGTARTFLLHNSVKTLNLGLKVCLPQIPFHTYTPKSCTFGCTLSTCRCSAMSRFFISCCRSLAPPPSSWAVGGPLDHGAATPTATPFLNLLPESCPGEREGVGCQVFEETVVGFVGFELPSPPPPPLLLLLSPQFVHGSLNDSCSPLDAYPALCPSSESEFRARVYPELQDCDSGCLARLGWKDC